MSAVSGEQSEQVDVVIVGGGPSGLVVASELALAGVEAMAGLKSVLIRPDGYVAWASRDEPAAQAARDAVGRWLGAPSQGEAVPALERIA